MGGGLADHAECASTRAGRLGQALVSFSGGGKRCDGRSEGFGAVAGWELSVGRRAAAGARARRRRLDSFERPGIGLCRWIALRKETGVRDA